nr:transcription factor gte4 [Quercus suber]
MASGPIVGDGDGPRERQRYTESKVYTRKAFKGPRKNNPTLATLTTLNTTTTTTAAADTNTATTTTTTPSNKDNNIDNNVRSNENVNKDSENDNENNENINKDSKNVDKDSENEDRDNESNRENENTNNKSNENDKLAREPSPKAVLASEDGNLAQKQQHILRLDGGSDDSSSLNRQQEQPAVAVPVTRDEPVGNGAVKMGENRVKINVGSRSKQEMRDLRRKLEGELDMVRGLVKRIEAKQGQIGGYSHSLMLVNDGVDNGGSAAKRVHSEVASVGVGIGVPREVHRPLHQLNLSVLENSQGVSENVEKEKRTPKANQFYRNSEFLLAKDKFPPAESNKKSKSNGKKQGGGESGHGFWMGTKF